MASWAAFDEAALRSVLDGLAAPWWLAGGRAVDLLVGRETRAHDDVDVAVLRGDQRRLYEHLEGWDLRYAVPGRGLRRWRGAQLELPVHVVWARPSSGPWFCELVLQEADGEDWIYRRDARVRRPLSEIGVAARGFSVLAPEIVLLYKAKGTRERDEADFAQALPLLSGRGREWLARAIATAHPGHAWIERLA